MTRARLFRIALAVGLAVVMTVAVVVVVRWVDRSSRIRVTAYFDNSNGVFVGDDIRIRGVTVGKIAAIEPEPTRVKISFWYDDKHPVPADAKAVVLSPTLVTARAIQLTPPYQGGEVMADNAVIGSDRTAVPVEWDDFRTQLERLTETLKPTEPGGVSTLGGFVNTAAENLRGEGANIREAVVRLSQPISTLGDRSDDTFTSVKNLATLVSALQDSTDLLGQLNVNLASVSGLLVDEPDEISNAVRDFDSVVGDVERFVAENGETVGMTSDKLTAVSTTLNESLGDVKQLLHMLPTTTANAVNVYQPAQGTISGAAAVNNFNDPITFICGAIQAASRLGAEQSAKLCVQYLAPIVKNRQYNFPPLGFNPFVGAAVRPNEVTYSEDWMRPDFVPPLPSPPPAPDPATPALAAEARATDPAAGLTGMMLPPTGGGQP